MQFKKYVMSFLPSEDLQYSVKEPPADISWISSTGVSELICSIMVSFLVPSTHPNYNNVWNNIEVIFQLLKEFLHPVNNNEEYVPVLLEFL